MGALTEQQHDDLFSLIRGNLIGEGEYRTVWENNLQPGTVLKLDKGNNFSNVAEWDMWNCLENPLIRKWLAPVYRISGCGMWLVMARTEPLRRSELPKRLPAIFSDLKLANWGMFEGRPVCHDYGNHRLYRLAREDALRMVKAEWGDI